MADGFSNTRTKQFSRIGLGIVLEARIDRRHNLTTFDMPVEIHYNYAGTAGLDYFDNGCMRIER